MQRNHQCPMNMALILGRKTKRVTLSVLLATLTSLVVFIPFLSLAWKDDVLNDGGPTGTVPTSIPWSRSPPEQATSSGRASLVHGSSRSDNAPRLPVATKTFDNSMPLSSGPNYRFTSEHRPYFIIHAGPDKTGTTAIQNFLQKHASLLEKDGYDISFSKGSPNKARLQSASFLLNCFIFHKYVQRPCHSNPKTQAQTLRTLEAFFNASHPNNNNNNILWSTEGFRWAKLGENPDWPWFLEQLQPHYRIRFVVVYRRYFDWLSSRYNEDHRSSEYSGVAFLRWPDDLEQGGIDVPSFAQYWQREQTGTCPDSNARAHKDCSNFFANRRRVVVGADGTATNVTVVAHPLLEMMRPLMDKNRFAAGTERVPVHVINFHGEQDLLEAFFCHGVPLAQDQAEQGHSIGTSQACLEARRQAARAKSMQRNPPDAEGTLLQPEQSPPFGWTPGKKRLQRQERHQRHISRQSDLTNIQYDVIALEAHRVGILHTNVSRSTARYQVEQYYASQDSSSSSSSSSSNDLPWSCPSSQSLKDLETTSLQMEHDLKELEMGHSLTSFAEPHANAFAKALQAHKFCTVNATKALQEDSLRFVLSNVPPDPIKKRLGGGKKKQKRKATRNS